MTATPKAIFASLADHWSAIPLCRRVMSDQLTPVLAYRRLVAPDQRTAPSFLLESVAGGATVGRFSFLASRPALEVTARGHTVTVHDHRDGSSSSTEEADPLAVPRRLTASWRVAPARIDGGEPPAGFVGGWAGYAGYDTVRYLEPDKLPFASAPHDDRGLPDMHMALYCQVAVFDHVEKVLYAISTVGLDEHASTEAAYAAGSDELDAFVDRLVTPANPIPPGRIDLNLKDLPTAPWQANFTQPDFETY